MKGLGLYIHLPFCQRKCNYCDFYSLTCINKIGEYIKAICKQITIESPLYKDYEIETIFIGGGTPSLISPDDFKLLSKTIKNCLNLTQGLEFTIEANPGTLNKEKLIAYKEAGVNRLSIGLQSTNDEELKILGRIHTLKDFENSYKLARECGFDNISVDLMYSLPNQTFYGFKSTLEAVIELSPEHISSYSLKIEDETPFGKIKDKLILPSEDDEYLMYIYMCDALNKHGYLQYEISNFAKKGNESRHNLKYWLSEEYIGIGPSAHSYINGKRYYYEPNLDTYLDSLKNDILPNKIFEQTIENAHSYPQISKMDEYLMLRLRLASGVSETEFRVEFAKELTKEYPQILSFLKTGYIKKQGDSYSFTPKGFFVSNYILTEILKFD